ncbi:hypothetical protein BLNAU_23933 [Blattamonas nauphoetae]|uniref:Uncharacterized protein n=1 Tax=Blattamonas nauphoetae TaxID=2049346 RepID=A0ABQ9WNV0_9EUKA|nr:hypothetical protein BLNAU_23933 [Blattamonas nauphoetae]
MELDDMIFPMEPALVQISRNRRLLSWTFEYNWTINFMSVTFNAGASHQPTMNFLCSSRIPTVFQSLCAEMENNETSQGVVFEIVNYVEYWEHFGDDYWDRGRILLQKQEQEGFGDWLEQTLLPALISRSDCPRQKASVSQMTSTIKYPTVSGPSPRFCLRHDRSGYRLVQFDELRNRQLICLRSVRNSTNRRIPPLHTSHWPRWLEEMASLFCILCDA